MIAMKIREKKEKDILFVSEEMCNSVIQVIIVKQNAYHDVEKQKR